MGLERDFMFPACLLNCKFTLQRRRKNSRILTTRSELTIRQFSNSEAPRDTHVILWMLIIK